MVLPAEFWTTPRSTSASEVANRNSSLECPSLTSARHYISLNPPHSSHISCSGSRSLIPRNIAVYGDANQGVCGASDYDCHWLKKLPRHGSKNLLFHIKIYKNTANQLDEVFFSAICLSCDTGCV